MPPLLNANAMFKCSHGGDFKIAPITATNVMIGGAPALTVGDVAPGSAPGGTPCPLNISGAPAPCLKLASVTGGMAMKVMIKGQPALTQTTMFLTAGPMPVPAMVVTPGQASVQGS